jgi:5-methylcytosine-specific restriction enzyme A
MAQRSMRMCRLTGCKALTRDPSGFCDLHQKGHRKAKGDHKRADPVYRSYQWQKFSRWYRERHPVCEVCKERLSELVHHRVEIQDGGEVFLPDNCQAVCQECHNTIHRRGRGDAKDEAFSLSLTDVPGQRAMPATKAFSTTEE